MTIKFKASFRPVTLGWMAAAFALCFAQQVYAEQPHRALFIGNSYTAANAPDDLKGQYQALMQEAIERNLWADTSVVIETQDVTAGGYLLRMHLKDAQQPASPVAQALATTLSVVVLQEQSQIPAFKLTGHPEYQQSLNAFEGLDDLAETAGATTVALMTWGRRQGDASNSFMSTFKSMQSALAKGYEGYVQKTSTSTRPILMAPAGLAFEAIFDDLVAAGQDPVAEDSIFSRLYEPDGSHPTSLGSYLAALTVVGAVTGLNVTAFQWRPQSVSEEDAILLRNAALTALSVWPPPAPAVEQQADISTAEVVEPSVAEPQIEADVIAPEEVIE
ncbi:MAG: hypothetical protein CMH53_00130, partial [Myxococcales bacterium]|nr:hypothetical protein [Myxococcales bacterium]